MYSIYVNECNTLLIFMETCNMYVDKQCAEKASMCYM